MNRKGRYYKIRNPGSMQSYEFRESVHQQLDKIYNINMTQKENSQPHQRIFCHFGCSAAGVLLPAPNCGKDKRIQRQNEA